MVVPGILAACSGCKGPESQCYYYTPTLAHTLDAAALGSRPTALSAGSRFALVLTEEGAVWGLGKNDRGQLGLGAIAANPVFQPTRLPGLPPVAELRTGSSHVLALARNGAVSATLCARRGLTAEGARRRAECLRG